MYQVTTMAPDWNTLNCVNTARHILTGKDVFLTTEQKLKLNRNLVNACKFFENDKEVKEVRKRVTDYQDLLSCTHQTDFNISKGDGSSTSFFWKSHFHHDKIHCLWNSLHPRSDSLTPRSYRCIHLLFSISSQCTKKKYGKD